MKSVIKFLSIIVLLISSCNYSFVHYNRVLHYDDGYLLLTPVQHRQYFLKSNNVYKNDSLIKQIFMDKSNLVVNTFTGPLPLDFVYYNSCTIKFNWIDDGSIDSFEVIPVRIEYTYSTNNCKSSMKYKLKFENSKKSTNFYYNRTIGLSWVRAKE
jgi:hypothetical protein